MKNWPLILLGILICPSVSFSQVLLENEAFTLRLSEDARVESLVCNGQECIETGVDLPLCSILQYRPYDNENFLRYPAKPMSFPSNRLTARGDTLFVEFSNTYDIAVILVDRHPDYFAFHLDRIDYRIEDYGIKRKTEIDEIIFFQLPLRKREHFGEWLNVVWDEDCAVCLMGLNPETRIDNSKSSAYCLQAGGENATGLLNASAALVAAAKRDFLDVVDRVEADYGLPRGVQSRRCPEYRMSYYELRDVRLSNIDEHIAYAKQGGFGMMVIYYMDFASTCGHFLWKEDFGGMEELKAIVDRIKAAGMLPGFHIHYSKVSVDDPYVNGVLPDRRLNSVASFTLASDLHPGDSLLRAYGNPQLLRTEDGRRLLRVEDEMLSFTAVENEGGICTFRGLERGIYSSKVKFVKAGAHIAVPDVDDWPRFIRIDQDTDLQDEVAQRLADIYNYCGFRFIYFDGAEDVPYPYWYNVSRAQKKVYDLLEEKPLFCEGALKSHFGWHILSRGNAFDLFRPERVVQGAKRYTIPCAEAIADDFTAVNFGWLNSTAPGPDTCGMLPEHYEFVCSQAFAHGCPISYVAYLDQMKKNPRTVENLKVIGKWEKKKGL